MSISTEVEPTVSIRNAPDQNIYTCRYTTDCDWCGKTVNHGDQINLFTPKQFTGFLRDLLTRIMISRQIPIGVSILISEFLFRPSQQYYIDNDQASQPFRLMYPVEPMLIWEAYIMSDRNLLKYGESICLDCCGKQQYVTRFGRVSTKPYNKIISTVPGSGFSGCDHYDHSFDGNIKDRDLVTLPSKDLKGFIVSDKELTSQHAIMHCIQNSDEESELSDYETEESDFDEPCWLASEEED